jgi:hypothetical protein
MDTVGEFGRLLPRLGQPREPGGPSSRTRGPRSRAANRDRFIAAAVIT